MHPGYYVEEELKFRVECYKQLHGSYSDEIGSLEDELEQVLHPKIRSVCDENEDLERFDVPPPKTIIGKDKTALIFAMLKNLRIAIREYAQHECEGCRINHPSQKNHMLCLGAGDDWIRDLRYHEPALECLNIYDVIKDWNHELCLKFGLKDTGEARGMSHLTPEEAVEAYKNWTFLKKNQYYMNEDWKKYWELRIIDSYNRDEYARIDDPTDQGVFTYSFERQGTPEGSPTREETTGCESLHH
ncbi:MAG: hypothetical protein AB2693_29520 [Candidatus Thiodiazotropha sp.]